LANGSLSHGYPGFMVFLRREFMEVLYARLPGKESRVLTNKKVVGLTEDDSCVTVSCADGSVFTGDIVVGCDGVHSAVRGFAFEGAGSKTPFKSEYRGLFGYGPRLDGVPPCDLTEVHDKDVNFMILSTHDKSFWLVTQLKDKAAPKGGKYSAEDAQALAERYADHPVAWGGKVTFGDLWRTRSSTNTGLYDYMEGVAGRWYRGRVVTLGDAAHEVRLESRDGQILGILGPGTNVACGQMTPNVGMAGNNAFESAASITNKLHALLREKPNPTTDDLQAAFAGYQKERERRAAFCTWLSGRYCRWASWRTWYGRQIQSRIFPLLGDRFLVTYLLSPWIRNSIKLNFVEEEHLPAGAVPWKYR